MKIKVRHANITVRWIEGDAIRTEHFTMEGNIVRKGRARAKAKELYGVRNPDISIERGETEYLIPDEIMSEVIRQHGIKIEKED